MISIAIVVVSDRSYRKEREDLSGKAIEQWARSRGYSVVDFCIVPDEREMIAQTLRDLCARNINCILTTGGTGFAPRDVTPEATADVIERYAPGFAEAMRSASLAITKHAMLSRAIAGIRGSSIIINLPGSPKAVVEHLEVIQDALPHAVRLVKGQVTDCAHE